MYSDKKDTPSLLEARASAHFSHHSSYSSRALYNRSDQLVNIDQYVKSGPHLDFEICSIKFMT